MKTDRILYYPYINIPDSLWTCRALLYWESIGVIVPEAYIYHPENLNPYMRDLVSAQLVEQIIPNKFRNDLPNFKKGFYEIIFSPPFFINPRRKAFQKGNIFKIHIEKFDNGLMDFLKEIGLAREDQYPWWQVETITAKLLMTYLATALSIADNRQPLTDIIESNRYLNLRKNKMIDNRMVLRNRLLNDILPLPAKIQVRDLETIKNKYSEELSRFRNKIEKTILDINQFTHQENFEDKYKLELEELKDSKKFIVEKLSAPKFGKIVFGTLCSLSATGIAIAQTPKEQLSWTIPSVLSAAYQAFESNKQENFRKEPMSYLALIEKQLKLENK